MRKIRISKTFPDGTDTFFAPKIKGCFDDRYLIPGFEVKTCEFVDVIKDQINIRPLDDVSIWLGNSFFIANACIIKAKIIEIYFSHGKHFKIKINQTILTDSEMIDLSKVYGCYTYGDFVDYCYDLCSNGTEKYKGQIVFWK